MRCHDQTTVPLAPLSRRTVLKGEFSGVRLRLWHPLMTDVYVTAPLHADALLGAHEITNASSSTLARLDVSELDAVLWVNPDILRERIVDAVHAMLTHNNIDVLRALAAQ